MSHKKKKIVWHKRKGKFIPSAFLKAHAVEGKEEGPSRPSDSQKENIKRFAGKLSIQVKQAAREDV